jgi:F-type H+-transporting ATPase subunit delta
MRRPSPREGAVKPAARTVAHRYARALHEVVLAREGEKGEQTLRAELSGFARLIAGHPELGTALAHPALPLEAKTNVLAALGRKARVSATLARLLELLLARGRTALLPAIAEALEERVRARRGIVSAEAVSAAPLTKPQALALVAVLKGVSGLEVELATRVDPALLGGLVVRMAGKTYDGSVRAQLGALRRHLAAGE